MKKIVHLLFALLLVKLSTFSHIALATEEITLAVSSEAEIIVEQYPASGKYLLLWLAPEYGLRTGHRSLARELSKQNIEVWLTDILESLFLPQTSRAIKQLDGKNIAEIIDYAHKMTGKKVIVMGNSYAATIALLGAHQWQQQKKANTYFVGAVLFSPNFYAQIPPLGMPAEYLPIVSATNIPIMIFQPKRSGNTGQFQSVLEKLQQHNNPVYTKIVSGVRGLFYAEKLKEEMEKKLSPFAQDIAKMISLLATHAVPKKVIAIKNKQFGITGFDNYLKEYKGVSTPLAINLSDAYGKIISKDNYKGQITVLNFWATWCPPCVEEIPSLNRLQKQMQGLPFELISINYAEDKKTIIDFMKKVNVEFPVLLDKDGSFAKQWNVIAYPSTFVIDTDGKIKYGVNAAINWDSPELINKFKSMLSNHSKKKSLK